MRSVPARRAWSAIAVIAAALVVIPVVVVASSIITPSVEVWRHLWNTRLPEMLTETVALMVLVGVGTLVVGGGLAWLVSAYRFPGRRAFRWLLVLPLAMPAYVLGFVFLALLSYAGPIQSAVRAVFGPDAWFPEVRNVPGAAVVMTLTLYPYVYLLARSALFEQGASTFEAARMLGNSRLQAARRVVLPLARPSLAAGLTLVMLETLTDFATVQYFNVQTVSVGVYRVWQGMFDRVAAVELAALVLVFALGVIVLERVLRGRARYHQEGGAARRIQPVRLRGWRAWAATGACATVLTAAFVGPVLQLLSWADAETIRGLEGRFDPRFFTYLWHSLLVGGIAAIGCVTIAVLVTNASRINGDRVTRASAQLTTVGYAVPGPVVAIGVITVLAGLDSLADSLGLPGGRGLLVTGSLVGLIYAYVVRFLALGTNSVDASLQKVTPAMTMSALTLGAPPRRVLRRIHLPLIRSGVGVAFVLILIDALKELPIVLLLRPFGFDTLSVWVWQLATESRWEGAALPALTIVAAALLPVVLLVRRSPDGDPADGREVPTASPVSEAVREPEPVGS